MTLRMQRHKEQEPEGGGERAGERREIREEEEIVFLLISPQKSRSHFHCIPYLIEVQRADPESRRAELN